MQKKLFPKRYKNRFVCDGFNISESLIFGTLPSFLQSLFFRSSRISPTYDHLLMPYIVCERSIEPRITWIGHATFLIQVAGINILTDPVFGNITMFFKRLLPPGITHMQLPPIDLVLLSHNHPDHMDEVSLLNIKKQNPQVQVFSPAGDKTWFDKRGFIHTQERSWWEDIFFQHIRCTFLPALHWSGRGLFDKNSSLWGSWMIEANGQCIYFAGDTSYGIHFRQIAAEFGSIDVALIPVGPCEPASWMARTHLFSHLAGQAFIDLRARHCIPMHWGTFPFGTNHMELPISLFTGWWQQQSFSASHAVHVMKVGQSLVL